MAGQGCLLASKTWGLAYPAHNKPIDDFEQPRGRMRTPIVDFQRAPEIDIIVQPVFAELTLDEVPQIDQGNPAVFYVFKPFGIVIVFRAVEIEQVFRKQHKTGDSCAYQHIDHIALQEHDVIVQRIVPFAEEFDDGKALLVMGVQDLDIQGLRADVVPQRVDVIPINAVFILGHVVFHPIKG